jgi:hypothetical protein
MWNVTQQMADKHNPIAFWDAEQFRHGVAVRRPRGA